MFRKGDLVLYGENGICEIGMVFSILKITIEIT